MEGGTKNIIINSADFQVKQGGRSTRKRTQASGGGDDQIEELRVRAPVRPRKQTVRNNNTLLKFIRRHQEEKRRRLLEDEFRADSGGGGGDHLKHDSYDNSIGHLNDDTVEEALEYLLKLPEKMRDDRVHGGGGHLVTNENVSMIPPFDRPTTAAVAVSPYANLPAPYDTFASSIGQSITQPPTSSYPVHDHAAPSLVGYTSYNDARPTDAFANPIHDDHVEDFMDGGDQEKVRLKYVKQKRIKQRTFRVGKSKDVRNVGVLVSNRTIRKGITTKKQLMKQTPIHEIRKYLVKHGLIKVGTTAPNEVLRKMYETSQLMCGELYNHNTDILLHNFMNDDH
jgi:hypothetical protein